MWVIYFSPYHLQSIEMFILELVTDHTVFLLDHAGHGNVKRKIVGITVGVTIFGLIILCVCIFIIKNQGKYNLR